MKTNVAILALCASVAATGLSSSAEAIDLEDLEAGVVTGASWNVLGEPLDPADSYTFLWGSAFKGPGVLLGANGLLELAEVEGASIGLSADVLYGYHRGAGYADHQYGGRIDVQFSTHVLRFPLMVHLKDAERTTGPTFGVGIEPIFGIRSGATVELTDLDHPVDPVYTTPTATVTGVVNLGFDIDLDEYIVPLGARVSLNPFMPDSTEERFDGFSSPDEPGDYQVGFDVQFMLTAGVRWDVEFD